MTSKDEIRTTQMLDQTDTRMRDWLMSKGPGCLKNLEEKVEAVEDSDVKAIFYFGLSKLVFLITQYEEAVARDEI